MKFFERRKAQKRIVARRNGYDFAAGALLRKEHTTDSLSHYYGIWDWGHWHTDFELGMLDAVGRLQELDIVPVDEDRL